MSWPPKTVGDWWELDDEWPYPPEEVDSLCRGDSLMKRATRGIRCPSMADNVKSRKAKAPMGAKET